MHACLISRVENSERGAFRYLGSESAQRISFSIQFRYLTKRGAKIQVSVYMQRFRCLGIKIDLQKSRRFQPRFCLQMDTVASLSIYLACFFPESKAPVATLRWGRENYFSCKPQIKMNQRVDCADERASEQASSAESVCVCSLN